MDAHDIFRKLTRGVNFSRSKSNEIKSNFSNIKTDNDFIENNNIDPEIKSEDEISIDENSLKILNDSEEQDEGVGIEKKKKSTSKNKEKLLEQEEINHFRNINRISIIGKEVPPPIRSFDDLQIKYKIQKQLANNLAACDFPLPTPIQMQSIPIMLEGRSLMACAPTGSGKTVAFLTPIIRDLKEPRKKGFRALILCPTRELAKQTQRECIRLTENIGLRTHIISKVNQAEEKYGSKSNKKYDILVSTPNRIRYLLNQDPPVLNLKNIEWFIIDEADKLMEEEGANSFKEQFEEILNACTNPSKKLALFSATYTVPVAKWALKNLKRLIRVTVGERNSATDLVNQELLFVGSESGKLLALRDLIRNGLQPPVLVFVQSKDRAKQLFNELIYDGINVDVIHAERTQQQRDNVVRAFREGKIWILICTELMGRGIDFKGVNLVINYDFPPTTISYIHRIGRTGRAGRPGKAITYFTQNDTTNLRSVAQIIKNSGGKVPDFMLSLKKPKKSDKKMLAKQAPEREDISTVPKFIVERKQKMKKLKELNAKRQENIKKLGKNEKNVKKSKEKNAVKMKNNKNKIKKNKNL